MQFVALQEEKSL
jgi:hypothetical protein